MSWLVGLDLRERSDGALVFADWMAKHADPAGYHGFQAKHVVETPVVPVEALMTRGVAAEAAEKADAAKNAVRGIRVSGDQRTPVVAATLPAWPTPPPPR